MIAATALVAGAEQQQRAHRDIPNRSRHDSTCYRSNDPILEAFFHARYFLEMACRYGRELEHPPNLLPSGWASVLYLYALR
jgi:hypothetical protein